VAGAAFGLLAVAVLAVSIFSVKTGAEKLSFSCSATNSFKDLPTIKT
jgi:hypothetical protein